MKFIQRENKSNKIKTMIPTKASQRDKFQTAPTFMNILDAFPMKINYHFDNY